MEPPTASNGRSRKSLSSNTKTTDRDLPPLPSGGDELLKDVVKELVRQIADKKVDTSGHGSGPANSNGWTLKENEQKHTPMLSTPGLLAQERRGRPSAQTMSTTTTKMMKMKTTTTTTMTTSKVQHAESTVHTHLFADPDRRSSGRYG